MNDEQKSVRQKQFKKNLDADDARRRREETTIQIRKNKKEERLMQRRRVVSLTFCVCIVEPPLQKFHLLPTIMFTMLACICQPVKNSIVFDKCSCFFIIC